MQANAFIIRAECRRVGAPAMVYDARARSLLRSKKMCAHYTHNACFIRGNPGILRYVLSTNNTKIMRIELHSGVRDDVRKTCWCVLAGARSETAPQVPQAAVSPTMLRMGGWRMVVVGDGLCIVVVDIVVARKPEALRTPLVLAGWRRTSTPFSFAINIEFCN